MFLEKVQGSSLEFSSSVSISFLGSKFKADFEWPSRKN